VVARFMRFSLAGATGFLTQIGLVALLANVLHLHYLLATAAAVEAAIIVNYVSHERYTWQDRAMACSVAGVLRRFLRFNALTAVTSIGGSLLLTALLVECLALTPIAANAVAVVVLSIVNFIGADMLVFRSTAAAVVLSLALTGSTAEAAAAGAGSADEAILQAKTARDFARYAAAVEARSSQRLANSEPFFEFERKPPAEQARILALLRRGEVYVERDTVGDQKSGRIDVDGGLVNHWRGTVLVPKVSLDQLLKVLQEPQSDKHKQEDVLSSRVVSRDGDSQKVYLRLRRTKFVTVVYDTEYDVDYRRLGADRALSNSISTRIVEIENAGTPDERALPEGNDHGYMWRLNSYWRYQQRPDGVLVEIESLTLSRDLPPIIGALIRPIVTSTARESMTRTLASVRARFR
jgi:putative flippase GtrA